MDGSGTSRPQRLVIYSKEAALDLAEIHVTTSHNWGWNQAERYVEFVKSEVVNAADTTNLGRPVVNFEGLLTVLAKWKGARNGHYIIYRPIVGGIYVVRILHTAMDLEAHLLTDSDL